MPATAAPTTITIRCLMARPRRIGRADRRSIDCVEGGAWSAFMLPISRERALAFWQRVADGVVVGERALLVAGGRAGIVGTVQLVLICREPAASRRSGQDAGAPPWAPAGLARR